MLNDVSPQILLAFLNDVWERAKNAPNTLRDQLVADQSSIVGLIRGGSIASVGKNSANQTYKNYGPGSLTQVQIAEILSDIIGLYDQLKGKITREFSCSADFDYATPADFDFDAPIYKLLGDAFSAMAAGTAQVLPDITHLRLPPAATLNPSNVTW